MDVREDVKVASNSLLEQAQDQTITSQTNLNSQPEVQEKRPKARSYEL